ncbi:MAG TPA: ABC transporter permease [Acidimicrobiales bacterium]|nr:ABC transporter permease [Acidimicrobiales bacterium]
MLTYAARRVLYSIPVILVASFLLFAAVRATFDPTARLAQSRDPQVQQRERERLGLTDPILVQYGDWLKGAVHGDLGQSSASREDVSAMISRSMGNTLQLIVIGALVSAVIAIGIGVYSAVRQYSALDYVFTGLSYIGVAMPPFWFGLLAIEFFVVQHRWLLSVGLHTGDSTSFDLDYVKHLVLPVATLCVQIIASWSRYERASMLDALSADYVRTARAKGVPRRKVILKHALRNALIPFVTVVALDFGALFGGLIITENIFAIGGMGRLFYNAILVGDVYVVQAWMIIVAVFIIMFNLLADLIYGVLDPRIRLS